MNRGDVWLIEFDPTVGSEIRKTRPGVVLTVDAILRARSTLIAVPLSTGPTARPPIILPVAFGRPGSVAVCDQLRALDRSRFKRLLGKIDADDLDAIENGIRTILGLQRRFTSPASCGHSRA